MKLLSCVKFLGDISSKYEFLGKGMLAGFYFMDLVNLPLIMFCSSFRLGKRKLNLQPIFNNYSESYILYLYVISSPSLIH